VSIGFLWSKLLVELAQTDQFSLCLMQMKTQEIQHDEVVPDGSFRVSGSEQLIIYPKEPKTAPTGRPEITLHEPSGTV